MKNNTPFTLSVPTPCNESWKEMTPDEKGRFCQQCQKTVIDFSVMSDQEMAVIINSSKAALCGRFLISQLNREIREQKRYAPFRKVAAVISALILSVPAVSAKTSKSATTQSPAEKDISIDTTNHITITGNVRDSAELSPMPGVTLSINDSNIGTFTNIDGNFILRVPSNMIGKEIVIHTSFSG